MLCPIVRWQLSDELDGDAHGLARWHVARCERCRAYASRLHDLHGVLGAAAIAAPLPRVSKRRLVGRPVWALGAVAIATVVIAVIAVRDASAPRPVAPPSVATPIASTHEPSTPPIAMRGSKALVGAAAAWLDAAPLHDELSALKADALRGAAVALRISSGRR